METKFDYIVGKICQLGTKYRDIADGNFCPKLNVLIVFLVGNQVPRYSGWKLIRYSPGQRPVFMLGTKYRDIADGNDIGWSFQRPPT